MWGLRTRSSISLCSLVPRASTLCGCRYIRMRAASRAPSEIVRRSLRSPANLGASGSASKSSARTKSNKLSLLLFAVSSRIYLWDIPIVTLITRKLHRSYPWNRLLNSSCVCECFSMCTIWGRGRIYMCEKRDSQSAIALHGDGICGYLRSYILIVRTILRTCVCSLSTKQLSAHESLLHRETNVIRVAKASSTDYSDEAR